ncbi:MAG: FAD-dependent oxidoreductase [Hyphomonadaceae bacterium]|nr:FAD-dependent oxidoreductase [Hyphomonadaceae bacterium]
MKSVAIVGAGVVGLMCAWRLARRGARVTVVEGEKENFSARGPAASLAAAGMLAPVTEALHAAEGEHPGLAGLNFESFDLWREIVKGTLLEDGVRFDGAALIADHPERFEGRKVERLSRSEWRKRTNLDAGPDNALFVHDEGLADPSRVLSGLAMELRRHGARLEFGHDVETVERDKVICFDGARFEADHVLVCVGAWANDGLMEAAPALKLVAPAKGHILEVRMRNELRTTIRAKDFYLAPRAHEVVLGATTEMGKFDRFIDRARVDELLAAAERALPGEVREAGRAWAGVRPMSPDRAPLIGLSGEALVAAGHSRNGWLLAPVTADIIAAYIFEEDVPARWAAFHPARFLA